VRRREFIALLGATAVWPLAARAQQSAMPVIGYLGVSSFETSAGRSLLAFKRGLAETGYVEVRSNTAGPRTSTIDYQVSPRNWFNVGWRCSLRLGARRRCRQRGRRLSSRPSL
jgi:putative tryptophan/tyrosine transport system substrate-binding protein